MGQEKALYGGMEEIIISLAAAGRGRDNRDDSPARPLPFAQLCLSSSLGKDGPWPRRTLWRRPAADGLGYPLFEEPREKESRRGESQSPFPLWDRSALPTSSAWLEKVVPEALGQGKMKWGWGKGRHLIHQTRLASQPGMHAKPQDDLRASF